MRRLSALEDPKTLPRLLIIVVVCRAWEELIYLLVVFYNLCVFDPKKLESVKANWLRALGFGNFYIMARRDRPSINVVEIAHRIFNKSIIINHSKI